MRIHSLVVGSLAAVLLSSCASSIQPVAYTVAPERSHDPVAEAESLIKSNVVSNCIAEPSFEKPLLIVRYVCAGAIGNSVAKMDRVEKIYLEQSNEWYRVVVHHKDGSDDFTWSSKSLDDMQHLADALGALSQLTVSGQKKAEGAQIY